DAIVVEFIDERTWTPNQVLCALPDSTLTIDTAPHIQFFGIVQRDHAWREGMHIVASSIYRRKFPSFSTEYAGRIVFCGDLIRVAHWKTKWGLSAVVLDLLKDDSGDVLTLSEPWTLDSTDTPVIELVAPDGAVWGPVPIAIVDTGLPKSQGGDGTTHMRV